MGPEFFAAPTKNEWDGETCTSPFMENVLWEQGTEPGYITGPNGTAGTVLVGGAGVIQQGLGRDHPFSIAMSSTQKNWDGKGITNKDSFKKNELKAHDSCPHYFTRDIDFMKQKKYGMHSTALYQAYEPCYKELTGIGGLSFQYNQMYSLSKD